MTNEKGQKTKVLIALLSVVAAAVADVYIIINAPYNYELLAVVSLVLLTAVYVAVQGKLKMMEYEKVQEEEKYDYLITAQKACYIQMRKGFREINEKINEIDKRITPMVTAGEVNHQKISSLLTSLMEEQKKVAKLTTSRGKENATAIMNSNDKVMEEMLKLQEAVRSITGTSRDYSLDPSMKEFAKVEEEQQELLSKLQQVENLIKYQTENVSDKSEEIAEETETEALLLKEPEEAEELTLGEIDSETDELIQEEPDSETDELMPEEPDSETDELMPEEPDSETDELMPEEDDSETDELMPEEDDSETDELMPELDFDSKTLSTEEIAALISGGTQEPLPETVDGPAEDKTGEVAMPDLSDPNKQMTPEEIAALIANM